MPHALKQIKNNSPRKNNKRNKRERRYCESVLMRAESPFKLHVSFQRVKINIAGAGWIILLLVIWKPAIARTCDKLHSYCLQMENDFIPFRFLFVSRSRFHPLPAPVLSRRTFNSINGPAVHRLPIMWRPRGSWEDGFGQFVSHRCT